MVWAIAVVWLGGRGREGEGIGRDRLDWVGIETHRLDVGGKG